MRVGVTCSAYDGFYRLNHPGGITPVFDEALPHASAVGRKISVDRVVDQRMAQACVGAASIVITSAAVGGSWD